MNNASQHTNIGAQPMTTTFAMHVAATATRMQDNQLQAVRSAIKAGAMPIELCRYSETGMLVLRVTMPDHWHGEVYDRFRHMGLSCLIPADKEAATIAWFRKQTVGLN